MSIPTISLITLNGDDKIGLSDTLDNYSIDDIKASGYVGCYDPLRTNCKTAERVTLWTGIEPYSTPFSAEWTGSPYPKSHELDEGTGSYTGPIFSAVVWMQRINDGLPSPVITESNIDDYKLVTEMPANKMYYTVPDMSNWNSNLCATSWNSEMTFPCCYYAPGYGELDYHSHYGEADDIVVDAGHIYPFMMYEFDGYFYFQLITQQYDYYSFWATNSDQTEYINTIPFGSSSMVPYTEDQYISLGTAYNVDITSLDYSSLASITFSPSRNIGGIWAGPANDPAFYDAGYHPNDNGKYLVMWSVGGSGIYYDVIHFFTCLGSKEDSLLFFANSGVKIIADKAYKPIITDGVVVGFTDDMTEPSELDDWNMGGTDHGVSPSGPPTPPPGPGYDDDPWHGATFAGTGVGGAGVFAKVYYMTSTELANLRSWMNSINVPEGFDPMQQVIGLSQVPVALSGDAPENVVFVNSSAVYDPGVTTRAVDTGVATQQAMGTPISYYLGSVDIVRRMQARGEPYLDYDCQIELYLPLIGMFSLDTQAVMGRTISAYAVLDPVSGTLAAYAYVSKDGQNLPIAYGSTTIGVDLPISAQQLSVSRAALKQANAQLGASLLSGALTMLAAASSGGKSSGSGAKTATGSSGLSAAGIREAGSDYMKASQVGNVFGDFMQWGRTIRQLSYGNNTAIAGSFGGSTAQWSYPFTPYVKIIRPRFEKPSNYAHSQGVPCVQTKTIGSCTGFIQCIGADVSGISGATDLELQAIQAALSNGIYAGGGQ